MVIFLIVNILVMCIFFYIIKDTLDGIERKCISNEKRIIDNGSIIQLVSKCSATKEHIDRKNVEMINTIDFVGDLIYSYNKKLDECKKEMNDNYINLLNEMQKKNNIIKERNWENIKKAFNSKKEADE